MANRLSWLPSIKQLLVLILSKQIKKYMGVGIPWYTRTTLTGNLDEKADDKPD